MLYENLCVIRIGADADNTETRETVPNQDASSSASHMTRILDAQREPTPKNAKTRPARADTARCEHCLVTSHDRWTLAKAEGARAWATNDRAINESCPRTCHVITCASVIKASSERPLNNYLNGTLQEQPTGSSAGCSQGLQRWSPRDENPSRRRTKSMH
jgi:hypothetical protein